MLIAIMTTSFDMLNEAAKQQLAFLRVETTYDLAHVVELCHHHIIYLY